ncbi:hypothetical protein [Chromobacterium aquaticum]|uniref:Uncharacterized protein n=1 Tax=Chromobacterium aquaticum TaxID=467180 RepID=A0ABV8ZRN0_9NEIS|nr:hypothetical protein [Chromobacterium aquaticum]MCD5364128.1 hypothetical protein [Chromobacterium aquaticum]
MSKNITYIDWVKHLPIGDAEYEQCSCPVCNSTGLAYQYFGFAGSEFGWKLVWCPSCMNGIRISRTRVPAGAQVLIADEDQEQFLNQHSEVNLIV